MKRTRFIGLLLAVVLCFGLVPFANAANTVAASRTASPVLVDGVNKTFDAYTINGNNYFKLRDLAFVLSGTANQFDVSWSGSKNMITVTVGKSYTAVGGEMAAATGPANVQATLSTSRILINDREVSLTAYTIGGNNYVKLRDLGDAVGFAVDWKNQSVVISTVVDDWYYGFDKNNGLYKIRTDGRDFAVIGTGWDANNYYPTSILTIADGWVYFFNNQSAVYRIKTDGTSRMNLGLSTAYGGVIAIQLVDDWIYYSTEENVYKIKNDGTQKTKVLPDILIMNSQDAFIHVEGDWIYYSQMTSGMTVGEATTYTLFKIKLDGTGKMVVCTGSQVPTMIKNGWVYYYNNGKRRVRTDGTDSAEILKNISVQRYVDVIGDTVYYYSRDKESLCKANIDGTGEVELSGTYRAFQAAVKGEWIFYQLTGDNNNVYRIRTDGSERQVLTAFTGVPSNPGGGLIDPGTPLENRTCAICHGLGQTVCFICHGTGLTISGQGGLGGWVGTVSCGHCNGSGYTCCAGCGGTGQRP